MARARLFSIANGVRIRYRIKKGRSIYGWLYTVITYSTYCFQHCRGAKKRSFRFISEAPPPLLVTAARGGDFETIKMFSGFDSVACNPTRNDREQFGAGNFGYFPDYLKTVSFFVLITRLKTERARRADFVPGGETIFA